MGQPHLEVAPIASGSMAAEMSLRCHLHIHTGKKPPCTHLGVGRMASPLKEYCCSVRLEPFMAQRRKGAETAAILDSDVALFLSWSLSQANGENMCSIDSSCLRTASNPKLVSSLISTETSTAQPHLEARTM